jgi:mRNA-degrading endonuclease RelE of RelBE toxin-antitoxin system
VLKIKASPTFMKLAKKELSEDALQSLIDELALDPEKGTIISGAEGIRKIRCSTGKNNRGKSAGVRVLYYYDKGAIFLLLLTLYKKSDKENIDESEKTQLRKLLLELLMRYRHE